MDDQFPEQRKYMRLADLLREEINSGLLVAGSPMPTIGSLCGTYGLSWQTVTRTLGILEGEKLVYRVLGRGYFVAPVDAQRGKDR